MSTVIKIMIQIYWGWELALRPQGSSPVLGTKLLGALTSNMCKVNMADVLGSDTTYLMLSWPLFFKGKNTCVCRGP